MGHVSGCALRPGVTLRSGERSIGGVPLVEPTTADAASGLASGAFIGLPPVSAAPRGHVSNTFQGVDSTGDAVHPVASRRDQAYRRSLAVSDTLAATCALAWALILIGINHPRLIVLATTPLIVVIGKLMGLYDREEWLVRKSTLDEAPALFQLATLYAVITWLMNAQVIKHANARREFLIVWPSTFLFLLLLRTAARWGCRMLTTPERCLVVGDERTCERTRAKLANGSSLHARVVGHIPVESFGSDEDAILALADPDDLRDIALRYGIDRIIIAPERADADEVLSLIRTATYLSIKISVVPRMLEVVGSSAEFDDLEGVPLLSMRRVYLSRSSVVIKRALDLVGSLTTLVLLSPILAAVAIAIKLDSRGPVLFRQLRIGRDGEPFQMLKFRTMVEGAHERRAELLHLNQADGLFKIDNDPRITRVGSWLRRLSLDELPQLFNVVRGEMSLVGPRPLIAEEDCRIQGWQRQRLQLTPCMTGHWQILGSARVPLEEMVKIDYLYVTNWSLWMDIKILLKTVAYVAARRGM